MFHFHSQANMTDAPSKTEAKGIFVKISNLNDSDIQQLKDALAETYEDAKEVTLDFLEPERIKVKLSREEKDAKRATYRAEYRKRPHVIEKTEKKKKDPKYIEDRKKYAEREDVKAQKKANSQLNSQILKHVKKNLPHEVVAVVGPEALKRKRLTEPKKERPAKRQRKSKRDIASIPITGPIACC
jgi:hypothetical protein